MHYNNAIYMGGMVSYKRNGSGILLMDEGTSAITEYCYDSLSGQNIYFRENTIISVIQIKKGSYEVAIRTGCVIIKIPFYEQGDTPNGSGVLIDYQEYKMFHLVYQYGELTKKIV
jgi:hypothetical protein